MVVFHSEMLVYQRVTKKNGDLSRKNMILSTKSKWIDLDSILFLVSQDLEYLGRFKFSHSDGLGFTTLKPGSH